MSNPRHNGAPPSVVFHRIGQIKFCLTEQNRIFLLVNEQTIFPSLQGSMVKFDDPLFRPSAEVSEFLRKKLRLQREIRASWPTPDEDEAAFTTYE